MYFFICMRNIVMMSLWRITSAIQIRSTNFSSISASWTKAFQTNVNEIWKQSYDRENLFKKSKVVLLCKYLCKIPLSPKHMENTLVDLSGSTFSVQFKISVHFKNILDIDIHVNLEIIIREPTTSHQRVSAAVTDSEIMWPRPHFSG
jgi:hypothetical protein